VSESGISTEALTAFARLLPRLSAACRRGDDATVAELREAWAMHERECGRPVAPLEVFACRRPDIDELTRGCIDADRSPAVPAAAPQSDRRGADGRWLPKRP
jgi:hypothetical protein